MYKKEVLILDKHGLHARPASTLVQTASKFISDITLEVNGKTLNAKSIIALLSASIKYNSRIVISAKGEDEIQAVEALVQFIDTLKDKE